MDPNSTQSQTTRYPLGWFKFLIYFALFLSAASTAWRGIVILIGTPFEDEMYASLPFLRTLDIICAVLLLFQAAFILVCRFRLADLRKDGPILLKWVYLLDILIPAVYFAGILLTSGQQGPQILWSSIPGIVPTLLVSILMIKINSVYFRNRKSVFAW